MADGQSLPPFADNGIAGTSCVVPGAHDLALSPPHLFAVTTKFARKTSSAPAHFRQCARKVFSLRMKEIKMTANLANRNSTEPATDQADLFEGYGNAATARSIEGTLLRFSKGEFIAGQENEKILIGARFVACMDTLKTGYVYWQSSAPVEERMGLVAEDFQLPKRKELGDLDQGTWERDVEGRPRDPWQLTNHLFLRDEKGEVYKFSTSSRGGISAIGELCKAYAKHIRQHPNQDPIVELDVGSYPHREKAIGRVKFPIFRVVGFTNKGDDTENVTRAESPKQSPDGRPAVAKVTPHKATSAQF
jgi:hypothetical protein